MAKKFDKEFLEAIKAEFLDTNPMLFPVLPAEPNPRGSYADHLSWLKEKAGSMYGVPSEMLVSNARRYGKSMTLAEQYQAGQLKGAHADLAFIDEAPEHPNCRCSTVGAGSIYDDLKDAVAMGMTTVSGAVATRKNLESMVLAVEGVKSVSFREDDFVNEVVVLVIVESGSKPSVVRERVEALIENARPSGARFDVRLAWAWEHAASRLNLTEPTGDEQFLERLRSKILERYPAK